MQLVWIEVDRSTSQTGYESRIETVASTKPLNAD